MLFRSPVPQPPEWFVNLPAQWAEQWKEADAALNQRHDVATARSVLETLVRARQPIEDPLRVNAELRLLLLDQDDAGSLDRFHDLRDLMSKHALIPTETGLPLGGIACHHAIRLASFGPAFDAFLDCFEHGVLIRTTGDIIALSPPLIVSREQIDEIVGAVRGALGRVG